MKFGVLILIATVYVVNCFPLTKDVNEIQYPRFIEFENHDGEKITIDLEAEPDQNLIEELTRNGDNNRYFLYTRRNRRTSQTLTINNAASVRNSNFNPSVPTVVVVHGWLGNRNTNINPTIRDAYLGKSDVNVIIMDWARAALSDYATAAALVPSVGRGLGQFVNFLSQLTGAPLNSFHLVGFSLGAHIVGNAGRETGGRVARVTGLDPAGPGWSYNRQRLSPNDGIYVEAIHTDGGYLLGGLGIGSALANADFFPNGGVSQPGCMTNLCNHEFSWKLFASTVSYNHLVGRRCTSMTQVTYNTCRGASLNMGNDILNKSGSGIYRLDTGRRYPY